MRVAYRESVTVSNQDTLELEKTIGGAHMYANMKIKIESTIEELDVAEL